MPSNKSKSPRRPRGDAQGRPRRKTLNLDQALLDQARRTLGARTESETVTRALEAVLRRGQQIQGLRELAELGPIEDARPPS